MEKKTMGAFIAALRKAGGMTQQEVADRLNVSNKTISKWERDEGYPEITIIPALAELFEVTSDEILRGERIFPSEGEKEKQSARVEKQLRRIINSSMVKFQNFSYLAAALALVGFICLLTTAYAFYRPLLGFGIMLIFVVAAVTMEFFLINSSRIDSEDHEIAGDNNEFLEKLQKTINRYSFAVFMFNVAVLILSLPFVLLQDSYYAESVISLDSYLSRLPALIAIIALICIFFMNVFREKLFLNSSTSSEIVYPAKAMLQMNLAQGAALITAVILALLGSIYLEEMSFLSYLVIAVVLIMLGSIIISVVVTVMKNKDRRGRYLLLAAGIRNILYAAAAIIMLQGLTIAYPNNGRREIFFAPAAYIIWIFLGATAGYFLAKRLIFRKNQSTP